MIRVCLWRSSEGTPKRISLVGHAGRGRYGEDIVCAAASALMETLVLGLRNVVNEQPEGTLEAGVADLRFAPPVSPEARAIIETIVEGLKDLAHSEPGAVSFREERWRPGEDMGGS